MRRKKAPEPLKPAPENALWRTREGFVVQVRAMTDMHLLALLMMQLQKAREEAYEAPGESQLYELACGQCAVLPFVVQELQYRGILGRVPESF